MVSLLDLIVYIRRLQSKIQYMGKQPAKQVEPRRQASKRIIKKKKFSDEQDQIFEDEGSQEGSSKSPHDDESDSGYSDQDGSDDNQDSQQSESTPKIDPQNLAVKNMKFRERRGTKMNYLINRKKQEQEDPFWAEQGKNYFGDLDDGDNDQQDYVQSSSGRDEFDSDFDQTESEHDDQNEQPQQKEVDEQKQKEKKKRQQLMRKIQASAPPIKKAAQRTMASTSTAKKPIQKIQSQKKIAAPQTTTRYIHQMFNQQELLGEAATTQYFNWLSLKKLISIETEKKDFTKRSHHVEGPKIVYRDRYNPQGQREVTYELEAVTVNNVSQLNSLLHQN